jgi:hypothetical protein
MRRISNSALVAVFAGVIVTLLVLAVLQYRWIVEASNTQATAHGRDIADGHRAIHRRPARRALPLEFHIIAARPALRRADRTKLP